MEELQQRSTRKRVNLAIGEEISHKIEGEPTEESLQIRAALTQLEAENSRIKE